MAASNDDILKELQNISALLSGMYTDDKSPDLIINKFKKV